MRITQQWPMGWRSHSSGRGRCEAGKWGGGTVEAGNVGGKKVWDGESAGVKVQELHNMAHTHMLTAWP